jgi:DNA-binding Xre family transcriptional regulator
MRRFNKSGNNVQTALTFLDAACKVSTHERNHQTHRARTAQAQRRLTQGQLAGAAGLDASTISLIEAGKRGGHPATLHRLAEVLECSVVDLVDRVK